MRLMMPVGTVSVLDMHCHTKEGSMDGLASIFDIVRKMKDMGYTGLLVSDHNSYKGFEAWEAGKDQYEDLKDFVVLKALEYDSRDGGHVMIILPDGVDIPPFKVRGMKIADVLKKVHEVGGICGMVHPFGPGAYAAMRNPHVLMDEAVQNAYDYIECYNAHIPAVANEMAEILNKKLNKPMVAGTDAHKIRYAATAATAFSKPIKTNNDLIAAIRENEILYAGRVGNTDHPQLRGVMRLFTNLGYTTWNKSAAFLYTKRRSKAWHRNHKNQK
ncbi:MAG: PHP-associated domain-containing protein [Lachnospiraceae bacterium]|nr:PHP-associated domain-containing protein [Lachnospiraceae bacterium]